MPLTTRAILASANFGVLALGALGDLRGQQPARSESPKHAAAVSRVACQTCPATLRIVADETCTVSIDGEKVGAIAQGAGKSVLVGLGEHTIVAEAGKLKWETNLSIDKPGQKLVKTGLQQVERAAPWRGSWNGQLYYHANTSYYFESFQVNV